MSKRKGTVASLLLILAILATVFFFTPYKNSISITDREKSIAVLPFVNMSSDKDNEYFSDGMTEEITTQLSKIADLKVIARTSSMLYKNSKKSIKQIAEELDVSAILEGSVQKSGDKIKITAQLIDANTEENLWAEKYDREFKDIFDIQSEVSQQIAIQLKAKMSRDEKKRIDKKPTNNIQAYQYYLEANQTRDKFLQTFKAEYYEGSKMMFEKAISLDSNYALAHAGLADLFNTYTPHVKKDSLLLTLQKEEINKAYAIAQELDYVNAMRGVILQNSPDSLEEAYRSLRKAYEINPNNTHTLLGLAMLISDFGLVDERITLLKKAVELDPLNATYFGFLGGAEVHLNRLNDGLKHLQTAYRLEPDMFYIIDRIAYVYSLQNNDREANKWLEIFLKQAASDKIGDFNSNYGQYAAYCYAKFGNKKRALEISQNWRVYLALGMKEEAVQSLLKPERNANPVRNGYLIFKSHLLHKDFDAIRNDPRFLKFLEKEKNQYEMNKRKFSILN